MTCEFCDAAERENPRSDAYMAGCFGCKARIVAGLGFHLDSQDKGKMTEDYRELLGKLFADQWKDGNTLVKHWASLQRQHEVKI